MAETAGRPNAPATPALKQMQAAFLRALREDDADLAAQGTFAEPPTASAEERWRVYRQAYRVRLIDALRNDYPAVARILGTGAFAALVERYLQACPPHSHDLAQAGDRLPEHLRQDTLAAELPFLPDLARFELALARAVVAADTTPPTRAELAARGEEILTAPLTLAPGAVHLASDWPLGDLWALREATDEELGSLELAVEGKPAHLAIYRQGLSVRWRQVSAEEGTLLAAIAPDDERGGQAHSLLELVEEGTFGAPQAAAARLAGPLLHLIEDGIVDISTTGSVAEPTIQEEGVTR